MTFSFVSGYLGDFGATARRLNESFDSDSGHMAVQDWKFGEYLTPMVKVDGTVKR